MTQEKQTKVLSMQEVAEIFRARFNEAMARQANEYNGAELTKEIVGQLNKDRHTVVWKLLGLDNSWGRWEVDHCNGRESPITQMMTEAVRVEVKDWLAEAIREVIAANRVKMKAQFRKALEVEFTSQVNYGMREHASRAAMALLKEIRTEVETEFKEGVRNVVPDEEAQREGPAGQADQAQG